MMHGGGWMFPGLAVLALFMLLILVLIGVGIALLIRSARSYGVKSERLEAKADDPLEIVRRRYAMGEITREEFQSMREDLAKT